jgi:hypothetical protein
MSVLCLDPLAQYFDAAGEPLAGGKLNTYDAVTDLALATYTDAEGLVEHENPIVLDSDGRPPSPIFFTRGAAYNLVLTDASDVEVDSILSLAIPADEAADPSSYFDVEFFRAGTPEISELIFAAAIAHPVRFLANFAGSVGVRPSTSPASSFVVTIKVNDVEVGTAACSTLGVWTFATGGAGAVDCVEGDEIKFYAAEAETTIVDVALTLVGSLV